MLPPIGAEIPCSILAIGATLEHNGTTFTLDFRGGIKHRVDVNPNDPMNSVRLRTVGFKVSAEGPDGMTCTMEQNDVDVDARSLLKIVQPFPPKFEHRDVETFTLVIEKSGAEPVILTTKDPMVQISTLTQFPPKGDTYKLERPVELIDLENPDKVAARITVFDSKRGGL
ncbi:hypothetical protein ACFWVU_36955 [Streptomyces sp. NPDC058686]|uniref:hypothetical protein n=1 Tax=Streptomyces sp. NPDC058686 TaxID=3346599 RepID=UPI0036681EA1